MSLAYSWSFPLLEVADQDTARDIVVTVHWRYIARDNGNEARECGQKTIAFDPRQPLIPFDNLTPEIVSGWLIPLLDVPAMQRRLADRLARKSGGPVLTPKPPPWSA